jgi:hypothetical protein
MFDQQIAPFCYSMAAHLAELGRFEGAREFSGAVVLGGSPDVEMTRAAERLLVGMRGAVPEAPGR